MARRKLGRAIAWSTLLHGGALMLLALSLSLPPRRQRVEGAAAPPTARVPVDDDEAAARVRPDEAPATVELRAAGDEERVAVEPGAPSFAPNPDERAGAASPAGGPGAGAPTRVTDRSDALTLATQPYDAAHGYQLQRLRSDDTRVSREPVRATPHPDATPWLSSRDGDGHARRPASPLSRAVELAVTVARARRVRPPSPRAAPPSPRVEPALLMQIAPSLADTPEGPARPLLPRAPAATDAGELAERVADRVDAPLVSDVKLADKIEMTRPAAPGSGTSGAGPAAAPGYARDATGRAPVPTGAPGHPAAPELQQSTYQRDYDRYLQRVRQKVDPLWEFPRELAMKMEQGDVLVGCTIRGDGSVRDVRVLKGSGFPAFDRNVLNAVHRAAPFPALPATLGSELHVTAPFEGSNPAIR